MTMGHARALLSLECEEHQLEVRELILKKKLSVRDTERKVSELLRQKSQGTAAQQSEDVHLKALEEDLRNKFGAQVRIVGNMDRGFIQISYGTKDDLMRISDKLKGESIVVPVAQVGEGDTVASQDGCLDTSLGQPRRYGRFTKRLSFRRKTPI
jgi:hypothetical protein